MATFSASGLTYPSAKTLVFALNRATDDESIYANISTGAVSVTVRPDRILLAEQICKDHGASFDPGYSSQVEDVMMRSEKGYENLKEVTDKAIANYKEWNV